ncbi:hypothetical protein GCM10010443_52580 [Actinoplanes cyaneus]
MRRRPFPCPEINVKIFMSYVRRGPGRRSRGDPCGLRRAVAGPEREALQGDLPGGARSEHKKPAQWSRPGERPPVNPRNASRRATARRVNPREVRAGPGSPRASRSRLVLMVVMRHE